MSESTELPSEEKVPRRPLKCRSQGNFAAWLQRSGGSLAITTYTSGKLVLVGSKENKLAINAYKFARPMGMARNGNRLAIAVREQMLTYRLQETEEFVPDRTYDTGKVNAHDVAFGRRGIYFANTRFNCLARTSDHKQFIQGWLPPFISTMVAQDRCHLNGLGMQNGQPAMATAFCETDEKNDWRKEDRFTSGVLIDVARNEIVARNLCMPHSPRRYRRAWWLCNSGHGSLSRFDAANGECHEVCALTGFTRGLCFAGKYALVGLSKIRPKHILDAPPVRARHGELTAGVALVNLITGKQEGLLEFVEGGNEVFEVTFLRGIKDPRLLQGEPEA